MQKCNEKVKLIDAPNNLHLQVKTEESGCRPAGSSNSNTSNFPTGSALDGKLLLALLCEHLKLHDLVRTELMITLQASAKNHTSTERRKEEALKLAGLWKAKLVMPVENHAEDGFGLMVYSLSTLEEDFEMGWDFLDIFQLLQSSNENLPEELSSKSLEHCVQKIKNIGKEEISSVIKDAIRNQVDGIAPSSDVLVKLADSLSLRSNQAILIEAVALEKLKESAEQAENTGEAEDIEQMIALKKELNEFNLLIEKSDAALKKKEVELKSMEDRFEAKEKDFEILRKKIADLRLDVLSKNIKLKEDEVYRASSRLMDFVKGFDRRLLDFDAKLRKLEGLPKVSNET
ncbi:U-box domain-containing protein 4 [Cucumis melo var. makuwa]|uniref:U-box domain-containing protein 4 n=1 Tax=Cucumis melo var. makuwa TaxID=1194695 RepID=A0A5D3BK48_CUCMM|nr:U-box domain-containing protein 4 [Cucumis melo var. makuwa]